MLYESSEEYFIVKMKKEFRDYSIELLESFKKIAPTGIASPKTVLI